ncbi:ABC transporter ATP-binding protein [Desulfovirgula thermocuniculi]|uniref:ABC transporter ATP-binding protein n=1 Tax=Desulfovirgula thermocuniculi TaxID=348842 RepID=UPI001FE12AC9|nr:ABC transporter ATP-binding protein [Desulfovirgula thermocuniculi]
MAFGGHQVLSNVSIEIRPFTFLSIIGPNGAGKTTFLNLLGGQLKPTGGRIFFKGNDITWLPVHARARLGLGRCFQITNVFPKLSVLENVRLAAQAKAGVNFHPFTPASRFRKLEEKAWQALSEVGLTEKAGSLAATLTHGEKRKLELAIVLAMESEVLLLDEPTAGISLEELPAMLELLRRLKEKCDRTILLVEHKMDVVLSLSDEILVLYNGCFLARGNPQEIVGDRRVQEAYLGGGMA